jgi:serine/threonine-protein phosphatase PP1 catalytic subunit
MRVYYVHSRFVPLISTKITSIDSLQILKPAEKKPKYVYGGLGASRPVTPPRKQNKK